MRGESSDPDTAWALLDLKESLDDVAARALPADAAEKFAEARQQWRHLVVLESPNVVNKSKGDVSKALQQPVQERGRGPRVCDRSAEGIRRASSWEYRRLTAR
jgi:hypothetical protein